MNITQLRCVLINFKYNKISFRTLNRHISVIQSRGTSQRQSLDKSSQRSPDFDPSVKPQWIPFAMAKCGHNYQEKPQIENQFTGDAFLQRYLQRHVPKEAYNEIAGDLTRFGESVATQIHDLGRECDIHLPKLTPYNAWGRVANELHTCEAWKMQRKISADEGIVAIGYERKYGEFSRLYQFAKLFLYAPSSGLYSCPIAMTDGAAKTIESLNLLDNPLFRDAYERLTSRDPSKFWTSGQWMTEKGGGSDVAGGTETIAIPQGGDKFHLYGYKFFSSATDADMAITLARVADAEGNVLHGTGGLTLFFLKVRDDNGKLNNINLIRLKDKLGTRQVPTAELLLDGVTAYKMSEEGRGVSGISNMLHITRIYSSIGSASGMRRILSVSRDYANRRKAFGKLISQHPLHVQTLARMDTEAKGSFMLAFETVRLLGKHESNVATDDDILLFRLLNPLCKLYVCKQAMSTLSEGLESFGGQGAMEDTGIPVALRDAQVNVIWEGTTNILSLDVLRCLAKTKGEALRAFRSNVISRLEFPLNHPILKNEAIKVQSLLDEIIEIVRENPMVLESGARDFAFSLARIFIASTLLEWSCISGSTQLDQITALRWCQSHDIAPFLTNYKFNCYVQSSIEADHKLVFENYK